MRDLLIKDIEEELNYSNLLDPEIKSTKVLTSVFEFNEIKPRLKSHKNRFQLSAGLNLEKLNTI